MRMRPWQDPLRKPFHISLFFKILLGYLVLLGISLILVNFVIRYQYQKYLEAKTIRNNIKVVSFLSETLDKYLLRIDAGVLTLTDPLQLFREPVPGQTTYEALKAQLDAELYVSKSLIMKDLQSDVSSVLVYMDDDYYMRVGGGEISKNLAISRMAWYRDFVSQAAQTWVVGPNQRYYEDLSSRLKGAGSGQSIYYIKKVNFDDPRRELDSVPFVIVSLRYSGIDKMFSQFLNSERSGYSILDGEGTLLYQSATIQSDLTSYLEPFNPATAKKPSTISLRQGNDSVLLTSNYVQPLDWRIVYYDHLEDLLE